MALTDDIEVSARGVGIALSHLQSTKLACYTELVFKWQRLTNLIGVREPDEFVARHLADCLTVLPYLQGPRVADIGSGAGLPGIVVACVREDLEVFLLEPREKRARFLEVARIELALPHVQVICARAEDWRPALTLTTLMARAVTNIPRLLDAVAHLAVQGQRVIAMCGEAPAPTVVAAPRDVLNVVPLAVPGWRTRHLAIIDRAQGQ